jgi:hypothetical protein
MKRIALVGIVAVIIVSGVAWGPCVPAAHAAPQQDQPAEPERIGIHLHVVVTRSAGESGTAENPGSRMWSFAAMTTSGQRVEVESAHTELRATPIRLRDGRIAVEFELTVYRLEEPGPPRRPGPPDTLVIDARADEVLLEEDATTVVAALTDETGRAVEVTFTATVAAGVRQ